MPFSKRTGYALLAINAGLGWANVQTFAHLPAGWSILLELAKLGRATLERLIEEAVVKSTLTLSEARHLVAQLRGKSLKKKSPRTNLRLRLRRFEDFLRAILPKCMFWNIRVQIRIKTPSFGCWTRRKCLSSVMFAWQNGA